MGKNIALSLATLKAFEQVGDSQALPVVDKLARGEGRSGAPGWRKGDKVNKVFLRLQEKLATMSPLDFGTMTAREFFLFQSKLQRGGAHYTKIARYELSGESS